MIYPSRPRNALFFEQGNAMCERPVTITILFELHFLQLTLGFRHAIMRLIILHFSVLYKGVIFHER
jgi:hypothetical protein